MTKGRKKEATEPQVYLVEQHLIHADDPRFAAIDAAAFASKNLYNAANYRLRQAYIHQHVYISYEDLDKEMQSQVDYRALPAKVAQQVLRQLDQNWRSFFAARAEFAHNPDKFLGRPSLPRYKEKVKGRNLLVYTRQAISTLALENGEIVPSQLNIAVPTAHRAVNQVRIVPRSNYYVIEVVYQAKPQDNALNPKWVAGIDTGLDNLAVLASNKPGFVPLLVNGKPLKSINQFYHHQRAYLQSRLKGKSKTSKALQRLSHKRDRKIKHEMHVLSRAVIDHLIREQVGVLVIGKNPNWKQEINLGKRTNQNFVFLPHARFIDMLTYKAQLAGIQVKLVEESYTSKCSFLDQETIRKHAAYQGKREARGLFRARSGKSIHADVNAAYNMIRKVAPDAFSSRGVEDAVVHPVRLSHKN